MIGLLGSFVGICAVFALGSLASNFALHVLRPDWSRKKHILWSSMLPPIALWLLVTSVMLVASGGFGNFYFELILPVIVLALILPFLGALVGIPVSWIVLKKMKWKKPEPLDDVFR